MNVGPLTSSSEFLKRNRSIMNKRRKLQVSLAVFGIIYFIVLLVSPGWGAAKILGIISIVATFLALYGSYRADKKKKGTDK